MIRHCAVALWVLLLAAVGSPAAAQILVGQDVPHAAAAACPQGAGDPEDDCAKRPPGGQVQVPNFFTSYAAQSGQTFKVRPPHNVAFIDYPSGPLHPRSAAVDPILPANHPPGCDVVRKGDTPATPYVVLDCGGPPAFRWPPLELGPINGHGPTFIVFHNNTSKAQVFSELWFTEPDSCITPPSKALVTVQNMASADFTFRNFYFDGNLACRDTVMNGFVVFTSGSVLFEHGLMRHVNGRPFGFLGVETTSVMLRHLLIDGYDYNPSQGHGEIETVSPQSGHAFGSFTAKHVVSLLGSDVAANATAQYYISNGVSGTINSFTLDHDVIITNLVGRGGKAGPKSGNVRFHVDDGAGGGPGNVLTLDEAPPKDLYFGVGTLVGVKEGQPLSAVVMANISGSGAGSKWSLVCTQPPAGYCSGRVGENPVPKVQYSKQKGEAFNASSSVGCAEMGHNVLGQITITNNYCDGTGQAYWRWVAFGDDNADCQVRTVFTGNKDLVTGADDNKWTLNTTKNC